jgi:GNAT superfamily N-acetyltransferase
MDSDGVVVRPMVEADVVAAQAMAYEAMRRAGIAYAMPVPEATDESRNRGQARARHGIAHDPETSLVAELDGRIVGVALAERRGPLWFLALLAVDSPAQSRGIGRRLLGASTATLGDAGLICASDDPKALRRYRLAGFELLPCLEAKGPVDRALIPVTDVREGSFEDDRALVESVVTSVRGAPYGVDLDFARRFHRLFVVDTPTGRGYLLSAKAGPAALGATDPATASALLWTALAEAADEEPTIAWLTADQQWAVDVALAARLPLRPSGCLAVRGPLAPLTPYLPSGAYG